MNEQTATQDQRLLILTARLKVSLPVYSELLNLKALNDASQSHIRQASRDAQEIISPVSDFLIPLSKALLGIEV